MKKNLSKWIIVFISALSIPVLSNTSFSTTFTVKGSTQATIYGFVKAMYSYNKQVANSPDYTNMPLPSSLKKSTKIYEKTYDKTNATADAYWSRLGFTLKDKQTHISGKIEVDFAKRSSTRLRLAFLKHCFNNFYIIIGQNWILEDMHASIDHTAKVVAGFNRDMKRDPQIQIGSDIDLGEAQLNVAIALEYGSKKAVGKEANRMSIPQLAARIISYFNTGLGYPARFYIWGSVIPVYVTTGSVTDEPETAYTFGSGFRLPIHMFTVGINYNYIRGAIGYLGLTSFSPKSWYDVNGAKPTKAHVFNVNVIAKLTHSLSLATEYDWVELINNDAFLNNNKPKVTTTIGQIKIKTTKYTSLTLEYRYIKATDFDSIPGNGVLDDSFAGSQIYAVYKYIF